MSDILLSTFSYLFFMTIHWTYSRGHLCTYQFGIRCYPDWGLVPFSPNSNSISKFSLAPIILHSPFSFILWLARLFSCHKKDPAGMLFVKRYTWSLNFSHMSEFQKSRYDDDTCAFRWRKFSYWFWYHQLFFLIYIHEFVSILIFFI